MMSTNNYKSVRDTASPGAREMRFVVFTRALLCVNLPHAPFYTRPTHCHLRPGNCLHSNFAYNICSKGYQKRTVWGYPLYYEKVELDMTFSFTLKPIKTKSYCYLVI